MNRQADRESETDAAQDLPKEEREGRPFLPRALHVGKCDGEQHDADAIEQLETALYFSMVTFTTLGYGDVTMSPDWRLLASFEAANGIIMFGWTTALIAAVIQRLATDRHRGHGDDD